GWLGTSRLVRAKTISVRQLDYVVAARALGQNPIIIAIRHILPNIAGPILVTASASVASMILAESVLSYLSVGIQPPTATWGRMLREGQTFFTAAPRLVAAPGVAILLAVLAFNLMGEGFRDTLDPRTR
ncbi:MAG TPA: ABC transporter permease, partial [Polyangiaceae bacterium]|nr:ABC transporter permease [Polyangiaceae bacterium]